MGLSLRDGFRNPGCLPTATGQGTLSPQPMTRHGKRSELQARGSKSKEYHDLSMATGLRKDFSGKIKLHWFPKLLRVGPFAANQPLFSCVESRVTLLCRFLLANEAKSSETVAVSRASATEISIDAAVVTGLMEMGA